MTNTISAPLLSRVKPWQLVGLGLSGWCTIYSFGLLPWSVYSALICNIQGGCFAATMTLAGVEASRYGLGTTTHSMSWINAMPTDLLNQTLAQIMQQQEYLVETCTPVEKEMGFGVRVVKSGRTVVFETGRWHEPIINLAHIQAAEENRKKALADIAYIVSLGLPDEAAKAFAQTHPVRFLGRRELMVQFAAEQAAAKTTTA